MLGSFTLYIYCTKKLVFTQCFETEQNFTAIARTLVIFTSVLSFIIMENKEEPDFRSSIIRLWKFSPKTLYAIAFDFVLLQEFFLAISESGNEFFMTSLKLFITIKGILCSTSTKTILISAVSKIN